MACSAAASKRRNEQPRPGPRGAGRDDCARHHPRHARAGGRAVAARPVHSGGLGRRPGDGRRRRPGGRRRACQPDLELRLRGGRLLDQGGRSGARRCFRGRGGPHRRRARITSKRFALLDAVGADRRRLASACSDARARRRADRPRGRRYLHGRRDPRRSDRQSGGPRRRARDAGEVAARIRRASRPCRLGSSMGSAPGCRSPTSGHAWTPRTCAGSLTTPTTTGSSIRSACARGSSPR